MLNKIQHQFHQFVQRGLDNHLSLAVTGLSQSGKTAFITSFIDQLFHVNTNGNRHLNLFAPARNGKILSIKRQVQTDLTLARFEYENNRHCFETAPPHWCPSTKDISQICLEISYCPSHWSRFLKSHSTLYIDIFDYPGEWLIDLPMLSFSFQQWSENQQHLIIGKRKELAERWLSGVKQLDLSAKADENLLAKLSQDYTAYLIECKKQGMHYLQPGRFILPDSKLSSPMYQFFPLLDLTSTQWNALENSPTDSLFHLLKNRFQTYQKYVIQPFYRHYFAQFDRQVILVDCLTALNHSHFAFMEMKTALQQLLTHFQYGQRSLFNRLFAAKIDKLLFVATKADHITIDQLANLESLLRQLVQENGQYQLLNNIDVHYQAIAAVRATEPVIVKEKGQTFKAIRGIRTRDQKPVTLYAGSVPSRLPEINFWDKHLFEFDQFEPKRVEMGQPIPHLRMDSVLQFLLADKLDLS